MVLRQQDSRGSMNQFFDVTNINWWVGVVIVGLAINLVAARLSPLLDKALSRLSSSYRAYTLTKKQQHDKEIETISSNVFTLLFQVINIQFARILFGIVIAVSAIQVFLALILFMLIIIIEGLSGRTQTISQV